ncbi:MAG: hypothetical protein CMB45_06055 [Euryarchaeota archaeon]|nr:hypothetical protein [Euryarchaeota archaeon]
MPNNNNSDGRGDKRLSSLERWRTRQRQLADYTNKVKRAKQRTLLDYPTEDGVEKKADKWPI